MEWFAGIHCIIYGRKFICNRKTIQFMPANHSNPNSVITILIHSDETRFQNIFVTLLRRVAKDVTSWLLSCHKRYDFNAANFSTPQPMKMRVTVQTYWIRIQIVGLDLHLHVVTDINHCSLSGQLFCPGNWWRRDNGEQVAKYTNTHLSIDVTAVRIFRIDVTNKDIWLV